MRLLKSRYITLIAVSAVALAIMLSTADASSPGFKYIRSFGTGDGMQSGDGQLATPQGIAIVAATGDVLVADYMNDRIQEFNAKGQFTGAFGSQGSDPGQLNGPYGLAVSRGGNIYVADSNNGRVEEFDVNRNFVGSFGTFTNGPGALAVAPNGDVYVTDGPFIRHFTGSGAAYPSFGGTGLGRGQFNTTIGALAVSPRGYVFASDYGGARVEEFQPDGTYVRSFAQSGKAAVVGPVGVAVTGTSIFISDSGNERAIQLRLDGSFQRAFATADPGKLYNPGMAAADCAGNVYFSDLDVGRAREYGNVSAAHLGCM